MVGKKGVIETGPDRLVKLIVERKRISVKDAAKDLGVSVSSVTEWAEFLEEAGIITLQSKLGVVYLVERELTDKDVAVKVMEAKEEKDAFARRIESSINSLQRDSEEIKLIDSEFRKIKSLLESNFSSIAKKLSRLENIHETRAELEEKESSISKECDRRFHDLQENISKQQKDYDAVLKQVNAEIEKIASGGAKLEALRKSENELQSKADEFNRLLEKVRSEIEKENQELASDEKTLAKSKEIAERLKASLESESSSIASITKQLAVSRKEFEGMESSLKKDLELIRKGEIEKVGAYNESKELIAKFKVFISKSSEIESLIKDAEAEEEALKLHFISLSKKVRSLSLVASSSKLKQELESLSDEVGKVETEKMLLSGNLGKIRNFIRSLMG